MRKLTIILVLILMTMNVRSQNIYTALHLNVNQDYHTQKPRKIIETNIFFNSSGKQVEKNVKTFDDAGMLLIEERFDENGFLKAKLTYLNDTVNRIILSRIYEVWSKFGYMKETAFYTYDTNYFLIGTTDKDANGKVIRQTDLICNENGHPIELSLFDGNGRSFGKEKATYIYDKNLAVTTVISNDGRVLSSDTIKLFVDKENTKSGFEVKTWKSRNLNGAETSYEGEYTYDSFGNCTELKIYKVTIRSNGKQKRANDRIFRKEYTY